MLWSILARKMATLGCSWIRKNSAARRPTSEFLRIQLRKMLHSVAREAAAEDPAYIESERLTGRSKTVQ
jgi:hypothetical protein